ncbi:hypothetical protein [Microbispora bryophytorum]|uniref:Uncharacterized protein n=1 Tax=Microbispora bryophytorum TaxID=1460882 RepID=A0A8H9LHJ7_9ACTN|nr:hypothetical protein [Microbispora bryophytorum]MBD3141445.1 hypothetical protein [Microbispora bryophytorum]TQR98463.1 hypothetical protein FLX07_35170 [Microbispora bryophytorum]GGO32333.1 hypothetical protein GCM10011574_71530 [Microbispora bryophytorum]
MTCARAASRRVASRGLLVSSRNGRTTAYGLPPRASDVIVTHMRRLLTFGATTPPDRSCLLRSCGTYDPRSGVAQRSMTF